MMFISDPQPNDAFMWTQEPWGRALRCRSMPAPHLFTSADVELRDDEGEWRAVAASLGVTAERLLLVRQVHGTSVAVKKRGDSAPWTRPEADCIITDDPDVAIGVRVADCAPILIYDARSGVAGAVHAGWRGAAARAAVVAVDVMRRQFGSSADDLVAAVGPCLSACCGEVGPEVAAAFRDGGATDAEVDAWFSSGQGDRLQLDLPGANRDQLIAAGVPAARIFEAGLCTKTHHQRLHSYRAEGAAAGRLLGAIRVPARGASGDRSL
jgi:YfiH family protein